MKLFSMNMMAAICMGGLALASCSSDDNDAAPAQSNITLSMNGLDNLGDDFAYEGWLIVDGSPVSTGTFTVDDEGKLSQNSFNIDRSTLESASTFVLSIEPSPDNDPAPAPTKLFAGDFVNNTAALGTAPVGSDFQEVNGKYIVATPTGTGDESEKYSGVWFLEMTSAGPVAGLKLPELADGWRYEGWVVVDGTPLTTGTFTSVNGADNAAPFSGTNPGPAYPGEDFLQNAPNGLTFPTDVRGRPVVISVEPFPDNSPAPFALKPLFVQTPDQVDGSVEMKNYVEESFPTGSVSRNF
ncbi:anti-sigma factor [Persicobacter psychrovividus]|uniref:Anti-sigma K factor RskA C-terminal domain-containing protein n=1 Tax=Persicobacter psychrovividus TaxID=387638 RepID=A0ABM7VJJ6_9BACT|nr:hypothetical protein PEPS_34120 [Persicobacter psychrovividus]